MTEPANDLILEILRRIQADIADLKADVCEIRGHAGALEARMSHMELSAQMEKTFRRLELVEHPQ